VYGRKGEEVTGGWRQLTNEELHTLYSSPNFVRTIESYMMGNAGHVERNGTQTCRILVRKFEGRRPIGRPRNRWILKEAGSKSVVCIHVVHVRDQ
jgi:hypothetical protein